MNDVNEAYTRLGAAIIATAVQDYRYTYKAFLKGQKAGSLKPSEIRRYESRLAYAESWFSSRYYYVILRCISPEIDAENIIPYVRKRVEKEVAEGQ